MRLLSFSWTKWKWSVWSWIALYSRTGTLTSPNEIVPDQSARGGMRLERSNGGGSYGARWSATAEATSAIAAASSTDGTWSSTTMPTTVAVAGRSATNSAYVERASFAIASWSQ